MTEDARPSRRLFVGVAGAAVVAPLAVAAPAMARFSIDDEVALRARLGRLEDHTSVRALGESYIKAVNERRPEALCDLFADPGDATLVPGVRGVNPDVGEPVLSVAPDGASATVLFQCAVQTETPIEPSCPLVEMAREQGEGVVRRTERSTLEMTCVKQDGVWRIGSVRFRAL
jgi:hypothetical protein